MVTTLIHSGQLVDSAIGPPARRPGHPAQLAHAPEPPLDRRPVDLVEHLANGFEGRLHLRPLLVLGDGHQDVRLVVGLVVPDPLDDRGVGEVPTGVPLHAVEHPLEGQVVRRRLDPLLMEERSAGLEHQMAELTLRLTLPRAAGSPGSASADRPFPRFHVHASIMHL